MLNLQDEEAPGPVFMLSDSVTDTARYGSRSTLFHSITMIVS